MKGIRTVDAISDKMQADILATVRAYQAGTLTHVDRRALMKRIDTVINRAFGLTRASALYSEMFSSIVGVMDASSKGVFRRSFNRLRTVIDRRDPLLWKQVDRKLILGGTGPTDQLSMLKRMLDGSHVDRERLLRSKTLDPQRRWVPKERHNTATGYRLSDRLWYIGDKTRKQIDDQIREAIRLGTDPIKLANDLERHLKGDAKSRTIYRSDGTIYKRFNMTETPRGGWGNFAARRLARTEIVRVNGAATIESAKIVPGIKGVRWLLSNRHEDEPADECRAMSERDDFGLGSGVYPADRVPQYPQHPHELCTLAHESESREKVVDDIVAKYLKEAEAA